MENVLGCLLSNISVYSFELEIMREWLSLLFVWAVSLNDGLDGRNVTSMSFWEAGRDA